MSKYFVAFRPDGETTDDQVFGYFVAPEAGSISLVQVSATWAPAGGDFEADFVDGSGTELGFVFTIPDGELDEQTTFSPELGLDAGDVIRVKVLTASAATGVTVNALFESTATSTSDSVTTTVADGLEYVAPTTENLCGCTDPTNPDLGRDYSQPVTPSLELPTWTVNGGATISFVDDEPVSTADT